MRADKKIIQYFGKNLKKEKTIRQISLETKTPYMTVNRTIKELAENNIITLKKQGKATICTINTDNPLTKQHLILAEESYKNELIRKKPLLKKICQTLPENNYSAILFGSYAKETEQKHSDIDIAFINQTPKKIQNELRTIEQIHDIEINTMNFTKKQFQNMLKAKEENIGKQILKNHVILYNPELFWNITYEIINAKKFISKLDLML
ncbi:hypothetical protein GF358_01420 [Candidatus Woesearchaeota archaeon]|nr:hypothetical protein [Candidatus Woesearchaeota archaeon]